MPRGQRLRTPGPGTSTFVQGTYSRAYMSLLFWSSPGFWCWKSVEKCFPLWFLGCFSVCVPNELDHQKQGVSHRSNTPLVFWWSSRKEPHTEKRPFPAHFRYVGVFGPFPQVSRSGACLAGSFYAPRAWAEVPSCKERPTHPRFDGSSSAALSVVTLRGIVNVASAS